MSQATLRVQQISAPRRERPRRRTRSATTRLQADRHHHLHRLQGLRGGLRRVERHAVLAETMFDNTYQTMPERLELLEPDQVQRT